MPDTATVGWFPVLTALLGTSLGYAAKFFTDWLHDRRSAEREREARGAVRRDQLFERRTTFQRQTLLDLQEAALELARAVGLAHHQDYLAFRATGQWGKQLIGEDLSERERLAHARTSLLGARVRDDPTRELVTKLKNYAGETVHSETRDESERALLGMGLALEELNQRVGEVLRKLDEEEI
jgi:hypothetical protein